MTTSAARARRVLVLAQGPEADPCVPLVCRAIEARGGEMVAVDLARFPADLALALELDGAAARGTLDGVRLDDIDATWIRHLTPGGLPETLGREEREACAAQAEAALWVVAGCVGGYQLDPPEAVCAVPSKARQQQVAAAFGLDVPRTLVTNDPEAVRAFARRAPGGVVCKLIESGTVSVRQSDGTRAFPTTALDAEDLAGDGLAGLALSPMLVQERLDKALELRVTVVGARTFVAAVDPRGAVDVRLDPALMRALRPFDGLPDAVRARLLALLDHFGLDFATLDVVLTRDGRWVLLEVNTTSFFDHVEVCAGLPISGAVAELLLGLAPPRVSRAAPRGRRAMGRRGRAGATVR
ncbi:MAG: MvdD family ATP-grasp ribosomal peptide maturase [Polyangiales bacterium]